MQILVAKRVRKHSDLGLGKPLKIHQDREKSPEALGGNKKREGLQVGKKEHTDINLKERMALNGRQAKWHRAGHYAES